MILLTQTDGRQLRGEIETDLENSIILKTDLGRLVIEKDDILDQKSLLDCSSLKVGTYVKTGDAIYLKINHQQFRLIMNLDMTLSIPTDTYRIDFGETLTHAEVFPETEEETE